jgi:Ca2+-binding RTX toxin-like protein
MKRTFLFLITVAAATAIFGAKSAFAAYLSFNPQTGDLSYSTTGYEWTQQSDVIVRPAIPGYVGIQDKIWLNYPGDPGVVEVGVDANVAKYCYMQEAPAPLYWYQWICPAKKVTVKTGAGTDGITVDPNVTIPTVLEGGDGYDAITGGGGPDQLWACSANVVTCSGPGDLLNGGGGDDSLHGADNAFDKLFGNDGNDTLDGGLGADEMFGGAGIDVVDYSKRTAPITAYLTGVSINGQSGENDYIGSDVEGVTGGSKNDNLYGNDSANNFWGGAGDDYLDGKGGDDYLNGGTGSDLLRPGLGKDTVSGGSESPHSCCALDTVTYSERTNPVNVSLDGIAGGANDGESGEGDFVNSDVENIIGGSGNDTLTGNQYWNILHGGPGNDTLNGKGPGGTLESPEFANPDNLYGEAGNDVLDGGPAGSVGEVLDGGSDTDLVTYASRTDGVVIRLDGGFGGEDKITSVENAKGGEGNDAFSGSDGPNALFGNGGNDSMWGNGGNDSLYGGAGNDTIHGGAGNDTIAAADGDDTLDGGPGADFLSGWTGFDIVTYADYTVPVTVTIDGTANDGAAGEGDNVYTNVEEVIGGHGKDKLTGNSGTNFLFGGDDNDSLFGLGGNDVLNGQAGVDTVDGGADIDFCAGETKIACEK